MARGSSCLSWVALRSASWTSLLRWYLHSTQKTRGRYKDSCCDADVSLYHFGNWMESMPDALPLFTFMFASRTFFTVGGPVSMSSKSLVGGGSAGVSGSGLLSTSWNRLHPFNCLFYLSCNSGFHSCLSLGHPLESLHCRVDSCITSSLVFLITPLLLSCTSLDSIFLQEILSSCS